MRENIAGMQRREGDAHLPPRRGDGKGSMFRGEIIFVLESLVVILILSGIVAFFLWLTLMLAPVVKPYLYQPDRREKTGSHETVIIGPAETSGITLSLGDRETNTAKEQELRSCQAKV